MSGEDITNIREYANGLEVEYGSAPVRWYDEYLNETDRSHLQKNPNNLVQSAFMIRVTRSGILLFRDETNFINRKRIHVKKYAVDGNVLYLMERDRMVCMVMK
ncbi:hypothetical protein ECANGB1_2092 [Enterospora canceri]|uniref:Uncharacterized protein n=1 Tax=Enterospora canceri TaxID=1081671 RepID=A0A1Y1S8V3_9MICR|nr:hypothetical protein ECANGB1_2092 [Enterospora canceri]